MINTASHDAWKWCGLWARSGCVADEAEPYVPTYRYSSPLGRDNVTDKVWLLLVIHINPCLRSLFMSHSA